MKPIRRKAADAAGNTGRELVTVLTLHGANLSLPGAREPAVYGHGTLVFAPDRSGG